MVWRPVPVPKKTGPGQGRKKTGPGPNIGTKNDLYRDRDQSSGLKITGPGPGPETFTGRESSGSSSRMEFQPPLSVHAAWEDAVGALVREVESHKVQVANISNTSQSTQSNAESTNLQRQPTSNKTHHIIKSYHLPTQHPLRQPTAPSSLPPP